MPTGLKSEISVVPLAGEQILQAYPLVREVVADTTLEAWQEYVATFATTTDGKGATSGALSAQSSNGYILGFCTYRVRLDLEEGRLMMVDNVIAPGYLGQRALIATLFQAMEDQARASGCRAIHINCPVKLNWLFNLARERDYWRCRWRFCKRI